MTDMFLLLFCVLDDSVNNEKQCDYFSWSITGRPLLNCLRPCYSGMKNEKTFPTDEEGLHFNNICYLLIWLL